MTSKKQSTGSGLLPRTKLVSKTIDSDGTGDRLHPFWDYRQSMLDKHSIRWTVRRSLDGGLGGLYLQLPYGYQYDVLKSDKSVILQAVADNMRKTGHEEWASTIENDKISSADWRSSDSQTIAISYDPQYAIEPDLMQNLSLYDPYKITEFNSDLMDKWSQDEIISRENRRIRKKTNTSGFGLLILAWIVGVSISWWLGLSILAIVSIGKIRNRLSERKRLKMIESMRRPGYILETSTGWLCWQYDDGNATPRELADAARRVIDGYIGGKYGSAYAPSVKSTSVSKDGRMIWFESSSPLKSGCKLPPYEAEKYLSLYVKHQAHGLPARSYPMNQPVIISSTISNQYETGSLDDVSTDSGVIDDDIRESSVDDSLLDLRRVVRERLDKLNEVSLDLEDLSKSSHHDDHVQELTRAAIQLSESDINDLDSSGLMIIKKSAESGLKTLNDEKDKILRISEESINLALPSVVGSGSQDKSTGDSASSEPGDPESVDKQNSVKDTPGSIIDDHPDPLHDLGLNPFMR
jgi:hypothetical protein